MAFLRAVRQLAPPSPASNESFDAWLAALGACLRPHWRSHRRLRRTLLSVLAEAGAPEGSYETVCLAAQAPHAWGVLRDLGRTHVDPRGHWHRDLSVFLGTLQISHTQALRQLPRAELGWA